MKLDDNEQRDLLVFLTGFVSALGICTVVVLFTLLAF